MGADVTYAGGGGLSMDAGSRWSNSKTGQTLTPDISQPRHDAYRYEDGLSAWDRGVLFTVPIAAGLALAPFTGGMSLWAAGALMGSVGGAFAGFSSGYIEGGWLGGARGAGVGALAGAAGGALGGLAGAGARTYVNGSQAVSFRARPRVRPLGPPRASSAVA
jgi:hypothetical protein